ncbi:MAG: phosphoribosylanthranilate isomerase [Bryobacterales bacterium]|nr:phosphoribosylanthranilate isomerase [Bryobacterales bacterium]
MLIKVCGITSVEDARAAVDAGATALGFNFFAKSPRFVEPEALAAWVDEAPGVTEAGEPVLRVGVFVNESAARVAEVVEQCRLDVAQLHGEAAVMGVRTWLARSVDGAFRAGELMEGPETGLPEAWLLDAPAGALYGGTGTTFDWALVRGLRRRIVLAGGLDGGNVARAIEVARPWGVDACSRLESAPGRKDRAKVEAFVAAARGAFALMETNTK